MKALSLFAGVGGFDLGLSRAGIKVTHTVEIDKHARGVLHHHWPDTTHHEDITKVTPDDIGSVDIVCGGFPCQSYSIAGQRRGLDGDERGQLWWDMHRLIEGLKPTWVVGENVPGLLSSHGGDDFGTVVGSLVELGYGVAWRVLDAQYFGVAQRRRRVFIVAHSSGRSDAAEQVLDLAESSAGDTAARREAREDVAGTLGGGSGDRGIPNVAPTMIASGNLKWNESDVYVPTATGPIAHTLTHDGHDASEDGTGRGTPIVPTAFVMYQGGKFPGDTQKWAEREHAPALNCTNGIEESRPNILLPTTARTLTTSNQRIDGETKTFIPTPTAVRRLTPIECERLQGFPDNWTQHRVNLDTGQTIEQTDGHRYRQMGNAVAVPVATWIAQRIVTVQNGGQL